MKRYAAVKAHMNEDSTDVTKASRRTWTQLVNTILVLVSLALAVYDTYLYYTGSTGSDLVNTILVLVGLALAVYDTYLYYTGSTGSDLVNAGLVLSGLASTSYDTYLYCISASAVPISVAALAYAYTELGHRVYSLCRGR